MQAKSSVRPLEGRVAVVTGASRGAGRGIAVLAGDDNVLSKSGRVLLVAELAREYGFTDVDGRQMEAFHI
jgi:NAD(P)-dependent dehydrogenase (short-subunit alcohol dehydrogenase family)